MRKYYCKSFATFLWFLMGLGIWATTSNNALYACSSPDVLFYLLNASDSNVVNADYDSTQDFLENNLADDLVLYEESIKEEESTSEEVNDSLGLVTDDSFPPFDPVFQNSSTKEVDDVIGESFSSFSNDALVVETNDIVEDLDSDVENKITTEEDVNLLIDQVESVTKDIDATIRDISGDVQSERIESDDVLNENELLSVESLSESTSLNDDYDSILIAEDYADELSLEEYKESDRLVDEGDDVEEVRTIIAQEEADIVALPPAIKEANEESSSLHLGYGINDSNEDSSLKENVTENKWSSKEEKSLFDDTKEVLSEDSLVNEAFDSKATEIEEINREYGWETIRSESKASTTKSTIGFNSNSFPKNVKIHNANGRYAEHVAGTPLNEFWIVGENGSDYYFWKYENNAWVKTSDHDFFSTDDPRRTTIIWAHGYQTDMSSATQSANALRSVIEKGRRNTNQSKSYRLVVWKWNSERNKARIRVDAKIKTSLANCSGLSLGKFIGRLKSSDDVCLIGFSFGAQVVGSALQYLATNPNGRFQNAIEEVRSEGFTTLGRTTVESGKTSLMLISAACDSYAFNRGGAYELGATIPTKVLNVYNPYDSALHYYPFVSNARSDSLGVDAVSNDLFPNAVEGINNIDVSNIVGRRHSFVDEINSIPTDIWMNFLFE